MTRLQLFGLMILAALVGFGAVLGGAALLRGGPGDGGLATGAMAKFRFAQTPETVKDAVFLTPDGAETRFSDFRGKTLLVNLWATWCAPCVEELPTLDALQDRMGSETFEVVTISIDRGQNDKPQAMFERIGIDHLALYRDPTTKIGLALRAHGLPTTLLVDAEGREIGRLVGPAAWNTRETRALIEAHLPSTGSDAAPENTDGPSPTTP